jgi:hypothetical protein
MYHENGSSSSNGTSIMSSSNGGNNGSSLSNGRDRHSSFPGSSGHHNNNAPSRVVHIRGIANDVHESEILALGLPFGRTSNVLLLKGKNQVSIAFFLYVCAILCGFQLIGPDEF